MHKHQNIAGYVEIVPYISVGMSKCCRPAFALVEGKKADINLQKIKADNEILLAGAKFIDSLVKQKIKVYINYENDTSTINLIIAYLVMKNIKIDKAISTIKDKVGISLNPDMFDKFKEFFEKEKR